MPQPRGGAGRMPYSQQSQSQSQHGGRQGQSQGYGNGYNNSQSDAMSFLGDAGNGGVGFSGSQGSMMGNDYTYPQFAGDNDPLSQGTAGAGGGGFYGGGAVQVRECS
jgi:hypothetical protein